MNLSVPGSTAITGSEFPRSARLLSAADFKRVFARPHKSVDTFFTVLALRHDGGSARLGLAISKKQVRRAVDRNRLKRLAREAFRQRRHDLQGRDLVLMARREAIMADNATLAASLSNHLSKLARTVSSPQRR